MFITETHTHTHKHIDKVCKQRTPPRFITTIPYSFLHIVVYVFFSSHYFIYFHLLFSFPISLPPIHPALQTVTFLIVKNVTFLPTFLFLSMHYFGFFFRFVWGKCNFVPFVFVLNDIFYGYEHIRLSVRVHDNACHKMHAIIVEITAEKT